MRCSASGSIVAARNAHAQAAQPLRKATRTVPLSSLHFPRRALSLSPLDTPESLLIIIKPTQVISDATLRPISIHQATSNIFDATMPQPSKSCAGCDKSFTVGARGPGLSNHLQKNPSHQTYEVSKSNKVVVASKGTH